MGNCDITVLDTEEHDGAVSRGGACRNPDAGDMTGQDCFSHCFAGGHCSSTGKCHGKFSLGSDYTSGMCTVFKNIKKECEKYYEDNHDADDTEDTDDNDYHGFVQL